MSSPTVPTTALPPQTVRTLTPVFAYRLDGADSFTQAGKYKGAGFKVDLRPYVPAEVEGIINHAHDGTRELIRQGLQQGFRFPPAPVSHVLLIEVALPESAFALDMPIPAEVQLSTIEAIRLHSSAGLPNVEQFVFSGSGQTGIMRWASRQERIFHLPTPSILRSADGDDGKQVV